MDLKATREMFLQASGRLDLAEEKSGKTGADWFINAGQRMLDLMVEHTALRSVANLSLNVRQELVRVEDARRIDRVWASSDDSRLLLNKKPEEELVWLYAGTVSTGVPCSYAISTVRLPQSQQRLEIESNFRNFFGASPQLHGNMFNSKTLLIFPAPLIPMTVQVEGLFYSPYLEKPGDNSFWTMQNPHVLVQAAMYQLEIFYRNSSGAADWMQEIQRAVRDINNEQSDEDAVNMNQMEG